MRQLIVVLCICVFPLLSRITGAEDSLPADRIRFFESKVRPLLSEHCWKCHSADEQKGSLQLDSRGGMLAGGESGEAIVLGKPDESLLIEAVRYESYEMPPSGKLDDKQVDVLAAWGKMGAPWPGSDDAPPIGRHHDPQFSEQDREWWAFQAVTSPAVPEIPDDGWVENDIDRFVLLELHKNDLSPADQADRVTLIRRLYFDLVGLPPEPSDVDTFLADSEAQAYERLVDRLLASPQYGQRWARHWLDLVRYADSDGYRVDHYRPESWRYRDYVIQSLNDDKPYDRFVQEQLAGDELFPGDPEALVATGYLQNGIYEYNNRDVIGQWDIMLNELTNTTGDVFLGLSMQCARCHDHKYDPILQRDYFRLRAFFEPILFHKETVATDEQLAAHGEAMDRWQQQTKAVQEKLDFLEAPYRRHARKRTVEMFPQNIQTMIGKPVRDRKPREHQLAELALRQLAWAYTQLDGEFKPEDKKKSWNCDANWRSSMNIVPSRCQSRERFRMSGRSLPRR